MEEPGFSEMLLIFYQPSWSRIHIYCYENLKSHPDVVPAFIKIRIIVIKNKLMSRKGSLIDGIDVNTYSIGCLLNIPVKSSH
jgi:hypothetical protein